MNPLEAKLMHAIGPIKISIRQFKTNYNYNDLDFPSYGKLATYMQEQDPEWTCEDVDYLQLSLLRTERQTILRHYAAAVKPKTSMDLLCDLSDLGVEAQSIRIPCAGDNCDEVAIEDLDHYQPIAELASEAEYTCEFEDGLCGCCHEAKQQQEAEEEMSRGAFEAREVYS